jgi:hypothetical protein
VTLDRRAETSMPGYRSGYGTIKRGFARRAHVPLAVPPPGRWEPDMLAESELAQLPIRTPRGS